jgi:hypothetical protein
MTGASTKNGSAGDSCQTSIAKERPRPEKAGVPQWEVDMTESVMVVQVGSRWAIKHNGSFLGYVDSQDEAARIAGHLQDYLAGNGRSAELCIERPQIGDGGQITMGHPRSTAVGATAESIGA